MAIRVWFDLLLDREKEGRFVIGLFSDLLPRTCANLISLLQAPVDDDGNDGDASKQDPDVKQQPKKAPMAKCKFHKIVDGKWVESGRLPSAKLPIDCGIVDMEEVSALHETNALLNHSDAFLISACKPTIKAKNQQLVPTTEFVLTIAPAPELDQTHIVIGRVLKGRHFLRHMQGFLVKPTSLAPLQEAVIYDCGVLFDPDEDDGYERACGGDTWAHFPEDMDMKFEAGRMLEIVREIKGHGKTKLEMKHRWSAMLKYEKALRYLSFECEFPIGEAERIQELKCAFEREKAACQLNLAYCLGTNGKYVRAIEKLNALLEQADQLPQDLHLKALYRRAKYRSAEGMDSEALDDLKRAIQLGGGRDSEIRNLYEGLMEKRVREKRTEHRVYARALGLE